MPPLKTLADFRGRCSRCRAAVYWARTVNGKRMPVDIGVDDKGNVELTVGRDNRLYAHVHGQPPLDAPHLHLSHFVTCPDPPQRRR